VENLPMRRTGMPQRRERGLTIIHVLGLVVLASIVSLLIFGETDNQKRERQKPAAASPAQSDDKFITGPDYFGCIDKERHNSLLSMLVQKDEKAFASALARALNSGACVRFPQGRKVFLQDVEITSGLVRLRMEGQEASYWAVREVIK
jgi:hypothetical protein